MSMDVEERQHLEQLRKAYLKRLRVLEVKHAELGQGTPSEIIMEIEDYRKKLMQLAERLSSTQQPDSVANMSFGQERTLSLLELLNQVELPIHVEIEFKGEFENLTPAKRDAIIMAVAAIAEIPYDQVRVYKVSPGSIIFSLGMPNDGATRLMMLHTIGDMLLKEIGVTRIEVQGFRDLFSLLNIPVDQRNPHRDVRPENIFFEHNPSHEVDAHLSSRWTENTEDLVSQPNPLLPPSFLNRILDEVSAETMRRVQAHYNVHGNQLTQRDVLTIIEEVAVDLKWKYEDDNTRSSTRTITKEQTEN